MYRFLTGLACAAMMLMAHAGEDVPSGPPLDLLVTYSSRTLGHDGVLRETRHEERMLRRPGHVWVERILPPNAPQGDAAGLPHHSFDPASTPRHVMRSGQADGQEVTLEFIDRAERARIRIRPGDYDSVGFDGSWDAAWQLVEGAQLARLAPGKAEGGARWYEREIKGVLQRVLWDEGRRIALVIEAGDRAGTFLRRTQVKVLDGLRPDLPWEKLAGYAWRDYGDYLD